MPSDIAQVCLCPTCLAKAIGQKIKIRLADLPHLEALNLAKAQPHSARLIENIDYTVENQMFVLSAWYLLKQGKCCGRGCRNCPYPKAVKTT
jgi:Family of unknown function (DUF5522)